MEPTTIAETAKHLADAAGHLAKPVEVAIRKIATGAAKAYEPVHLRRMARARADATFIEQISEQDRNELKAAYERREDYRKVRKEHNLGLIADRASEKLNDVSPGEQSAPDDEWLDEFENNAEDASSEPLQEMWSRILSGEIQRKGTIPRRMLRHLRDIDQRTAELFQKVYNCSVLGNARLLFRFDGWERYVGITHFDLVELGDIGLVHVPTLKQAEIMENGGLLFFDRQIVFGPKRDGAKPIEYLLFSRVGEVLARVCDAAPNVAYFNKLTEVMTSANWTFQVLVASTMGARNR
jgi:hypothetical protein